MTDRGNTTLDLSTKGQSKYVIFSTASVCQETNLYFFLTTMIVSILQCFNKTEYNGLSTRVKTVPPDKNQLNILSSYLVQAVTSTTTQCLRVCWI